MVFTIRQEWNRVTVFRRSGQRYAISWNPKMSTHADISSILREQRVFEPSDEFRQKAHIASTAQYEALYRAAEEDPDRFWAELARELHWFKLWDKVLDWDLPFAKWFVGGQINLSYNCLDRHVQGPRKNKAAILWEGEPGDTRTLTYQQLLAEVEKCANMLKSLGVKKGERVALYMGMVPELPVAMLACARIGAPHTVIFGGFASHALVDRINDCGAVLIVTQDAAHRRGTEVGLKEAVDKAVPDCPTIRNVVVYRRT